MAKRMDDTETLGEFLRDVAMNVVVIVTVFLIVHFFIAAPFQVVGNSMISTLQDDEYIVVSKLEYLIGNPGRGDIVVFHPPQNADDYYIKRVIGIPGDTVQLKSGDVFVNGLKIGESFLDEGMITCLVPHMKSCPGDNRTYQVPDDQYFVLGDNRHGSSDSRGWFDDDNKPSPFVTRSSIQGKTRMVVFPLPSVRIIDQTSVFDEALNGLRAN
ncbi:MAG: signal peptidase I [Candidatus Gracilibacteria bacterium]|nr:signal peptidase I [Candidatus Gracilibacteria bacterium]